MPDRLQLSRKKGSRLPLGAKSVARPSKWGNPFRVRPAKVWLGDWLLVHEGALIGRFGSKWAANRQAVESYQAWLSKSGLDLTELRGLSLACYCPLPEPGEIDWCHARVLIEESNK